MRNHGLCLALLGVWVLPGALMAQVDSIDGLGVDKLSTGIESGQTVESGSGINNVAGQLPPASPDSNWDDLAERDPQFKRNLDVIYKRLLYGAERTRTSMSWANDMFFAFGWLERIINGVGRPVTDRWYTNGIHFSQLINTDVYAGRDERWGLQVKLGTDHQMFTPADITCPCFNLNDRPYAGMWTGELLFRLRNVKLADLRPSWTVTPNELTLVRDMSIEFSFRGGIIGPQSFARELQTWAHGASGAPAPQGWDLQLGPQGVFQFGADFIYNWPIIDTNALGAVLSVSAGGEIGTVMIEARSGAEFRLRFGQRLVSARMERAMKRLQYQQSAANPPELPGWVDDDEFPVWHLDGFARFDLAFRPYNYLLADLEPVWLVSTLTVGLDLALGPMVFGAGTSWTTPEFGQAGRIFGNRSSYGGWIKVEILWGRIA